MNTKQNGFTIPHLLMLLVVLGAIGGTGWYVYKMNTTEPMPANGSSMPTSTASNKPMPQSNDSKPDSNVSSTWLLRKSAAASIRVPDGFDIFASSNEPVNFVLPDVPQGTLKYVKGQTAKVVSEPPAKHFDLGLIAGLNDQGFNDKGTKDREFKTYSGLDVTVSSYKQLEEPDGIGFPKGATHLKYTVTKGAQFFNVDYVYLGEGLITPIDEMVRSIEIY